MRRPLTAPATFRDFQEFPEATREYAILHGLGKTPEERFRHCSKALNAANDNNIPPGVAFLMTSEPLMAMLKVWVECDRDMVRAKLTYLGE